jgi:predicted ABC-type exoprotein transport system permease subunit
MVGLLRLPPLLVLVIVLAIMAYLVYHIVATGTVQPLTIILLVLLGFALVRVLFRMRRKAQESESESE